MLVSDDWRAMRAHESIRHDDKAASWLAPKGDDCRFDLCVAMNGAVISATLSDRCPYRKPKIGWPIPANRVIFSAMVDLLRLVWCLVTGLFGSRAALQAEILVLRHQVNVLRRESPKRLVFSNIDRLIFAGLYGLVMPSVGNAFRILKPATVIACHRAGFRSLLALEISTLWRPTTGIVRGSRAYS
jgi:hypothetical protein